jgi:CxxC motif-containing protein (DUF1111 family)
VTFLAPAPTDNSDSASATRGRPIFTQIGCAACHRAQAFTTPAASANGVPGGMQFFPFSDFLLHDMGSLGDLMGTEGTPTGGGVRRRMRTAPLWGIRLRNNLLHDGRTTDIPTAIRAHDGQGAASVTRFNQLTAAQRHDLVQFIRSL